MNRAAFAPTAVAATARESAAKPVVPTFLMYSFPAYYLPFWSSLAARSLSPACDLTPGPRSFLVAFVAALSLSPAVQAKKKQSPPAPASTSSKHSW